MRTRKVGEKNVPMPNPDIAYANVKLYECPCGEGLIQELTLFSNKGEEPFGEVGMTCEDCLQKWTMDTVADGLVDSWTLVPLTEDAVIANPVTLDELMEEMEPYIMTPERWEAMTGEKITADDDTSTSELPAGMNRADRRKWWKAHRKNK